METMVKIEASVEELDPTIKRIKQETNDDKELDRMIKENKQVTDDGEELDRTIAQIKQELNDKNNLRSKKRNIKRIKQETPKKGRSPKDSNKCPYCSKIFKPHLLKIHVRVHTGERPYKCDECPKAFKQLPQLDSHKLTHTKEKQYRCDECGREFKFTQAYRRHLKLHTGEKKYSCDQCDYKCIVAERLKQHKVTHLKTLTVTCGICQMMFKSKDALRYHMAVHNKADYKCDICSKHFTLARYLVRHKTVHKQKGMKVCEKCDYKTTSDTLFENHLKLHVKDEVLEKVGCDQCGFETYSKMALYSHTRRHNTDLFPKCLYCNYHPRKNVLLRKHIVSAHGGIKDFKCEECAETFITPSDKRQHRKLLHKQTTFQCEACLKYFSTGTILRRHIRDNCKEKLLSVELSRDVKPDPLAVENDVKNEEMHEIEDEDCQDFEQVVIKEEKLD